MSKKFLSAFLFLPAVASAGITSRAECILEYMPGVANDPVASLVVRHCRNTYSGSKYNAVPRSSGEGGIENALDCALKYAATTPGEEAAEAIVDACKDLYPE